MQDRKHEKYVDNLFGATLVGSLEGYSRLIGKAFGDRLQAIQRLLVMLGTLVNHLTVSIVYPSNKFSHGG